MTNLLSYGIATILVYYFAYFAARVLSKKAVAQMTAYELIGIMIIATVAAEPLVTKVMTQAMFGTGLLVGLILISARIARNNRATKYMEHTPSILVKDGKLQLDMLRSVDLTVNTFYGLLRQKGYSKVDELEYVILEPQGSISAFPKSQNRPVRPSDMNLPTKYEGITFPLIVDGRVMRDCLDFVNLSEQWLLDSLHKQGIDSFDQAALAELDSSGNLYVTAKD